MVKRAPEGVRRLAFGLAAATLVTGLAGGLLRAGIALPGSGSATLGHAAVQHGALMITGFFATVIGIERAVAVRHPSAWLAPLGAGLAALLMLLGAWRAGAWMGLAASLAFVAVHTRIVRTQAAAHTRVLWCSAAAWSIGQLGFATGWWAHAAIAWWFAFLVLTIAAERLEMTRLTRRRPAAQPALYLVLALLGFGAAATAWDERTGAVAYGLALLLLALWLGLFDIARRTVLTQGLSRYMAVCLLSGYVWLGIAGLAWMATALGWPARDAALHALGLGFVFSMVMGHAPVILPAVAGIKVRYRPHFYVPLALLHLSLAWRLAGSAAEADVRGLAAALNVGALSLFAACMIAGVRAARR